MASFKGQAQEIIERMEKEGRVKTLSREATEKIDAQLGDAFAKIKQQSERLQRKSRYAVSEMEKRLPLARSSFNDAAATAVQPFKKISRFIINFFKK